MVIPWVVGDASCMPVGLGTCTGMEDTLVGNFVAAVVFVVLVSVGLFYVLVLIVWKRMVQLFGIWPLRNTR